MANQSVINDSTLTAIANAINAKAGTTGKMLPSAMAGKIAAIQASDDESTFVPDDLPKDFKQTVYNNMGGFAYAVGLLFRTSVCLGNTYKFLGKDIITSDGQHFENGSNTTPRSITINRADENGWWWVILRDNDYRVWNSASVNLKYRGLTWVQGTEGASIFYYYNSPLVHSKAGELDLVRIIDCNSHGTYVGTLTNFHTLYMVRCRVHLKNTNSGDINTGGYFSGEGRLRYADITWSTDRSFSCGSMFYNCYSLTRVPEVMDLSNCTSCAYMFTNCHSLVRIPEVMDLSSCTSCASMFANCYSLTRVPEVMDLSNCTSCASMFANCHSLVRIPEVMDLSSCTSCASMFQDCYSLVRFPTHVTVNVSLSFSGISGNADKDSIAEFDESGNLIGGMVYNLNTCNKDGQTITLSSTHKAKFTEAEQTAIAECLTNKNWGLSW